jgi:hypothetical protein
MSIPSCALLPFLEGEREKERLIDRILAIGRNRPELLLRLVRGIRRFVCGILRLVNY